MSRRGRKLAWSYYDAALLEKCGFPVKIVVGEETNLKITNWGIGIAEYILSQRL
jgi:2-C-methyl-D-erythritol 4-phosphate cytidylyltransferase